MHKLSILLIEDNLTIARQLAEVFSGHQWQVDFADNGLLGINLALNQIYDVIILDLNLPDIDGFEVCSEIKKNSNVTPPILMLTARDSFEDKAEGFGLGADDYVTKPFEFRELVLRCQALARRHQLHQSQTLEVGELTIDRSKHQAIRKGQLLKLTNIGFNILTILAQAYPQPVSRSKLIHSIWGDQPPETDALRTHIYSLRNVLDKPFNQSMLTTITNIGYKLEFPNEEE